MSFDALNTDWKIQEADNVRRRGPSTAFGAARPPQFFDTPARTGGKQEKKENRKQELLQMLASIERTLPRITAFLKEGKAFSENSEQLAYFTNLLDTFRTQVKAFTKRDALSYKSMGYFELLQEYLSNSIFMLETHLGKTRKNLRNTTAAQTISIIDKRSNTLREGKMKKDITLLKEDVDDLFAAGLSIHNFPSLWRAALPNGFTNKHDKKIDFAYVKGNADIYQAQYDKTLSVFKKFHGRALWQLSVQEQTELLSAAGTLRKYCSRPLEFLAESIRMCKEQNPKIKSKKNQPLQRLIGLYDAFATIEEVCKDLSKRITRIQEHEAILNRSSSAMKEGITLLEKAEAVYPVLRSVLIDTSRHLMDTRTRITSYTGGSQRMITPEQEAFAQKYVTAIGEAVSILQDTHEIWHKELSGELVERKKGKKKEKKS